MIQILRLLFKVDLPTQFKKFNKMYPLLVGSRHGSSFLHVGCDARVAYLGRPQGGETKAGWVRESVIVDKWANINSCCGAPGSAARKRWQHLKGIGEMWKQQKLSAPFFNDTSWIMHPLRSFTQGVCFRSDTCTQCRRTTPSIIIAF